MRSLCLILAALALGAAGPRGAGYTGATIGKSATTVDASWTSGSASASTLICDGVAAADNGTQTSTTTHSGIVAGLAPAAFHWCRAQSGSTVSAVFRVYTDAAPATTPITGLTWGSIAQPVTNQIMGDTWHDCISNDNVTYFIGDDTQSGWSADGSNVNSNMLLNKFASESPLTGNIVNRLSNFGAQNTTNVGETGTGNYKADGIFCDRGNIYITFGQHGGTGAGAGGSSWTQMMMSANHGASWTSFQNPTGTPNANGVRPTPYNTLMFADATVLQEGSFIQHWPDDGTVGPRVSNADAYAYYVYNDGHWENGNAMYLARVAKAKLPSLLGADWQFFTGGDGNLDANWSSTASSATAMLSGTQQFSIPAATYIPSLNRYLLWTWYYTDTTFVASCSTSCDGTKAQRTTFKTYEAAKPWGPWTLIDTKVFTSEGYYGPSPTVRSMIAAKPDDAGNPLKVLFSGNPFLNATTWYRLWAASVTVKTQ